MTLLGLFVIFSSGIYGTATGTIELQEGTLKDIEYMKNRKSS